MKPLILWIGKSGSGKTTIVNYLANRGYESLQSYTTRPPRFDGEVGHIFVSDVEFNKLENIVAYTEYNGCRYCCTEEQLNKADCYVVDVPGVEFLLEKYTNAERPIFVFYLDTTVTTRIDRMVDRGDSDHAIVSRLHQDEGYDWYDKLYKIAYHYKNNLQRDIKLTKIDANKAQEEVIRDVLEIINNNEGESNIEHSRMAWGK